MIKKLILIAVSLLIIGFESIAQSSFASNFQKEIYFEMHGRYQRAIKKEGFIKAKLISDVISGYPVNWITEYISVEVQATCNGKKMKAIGKNQNLTQEQKSILNTADLATNIEINVKYNYRDPIFNNVEKNNMRVSMMIVPETEAEFIGGELSMKKYVKENIINKIIEKTAEKFQRGIVSFIISEKGEITETKIVKSSGDAATDKLLIELINKMPNWKPAENIKGEKQKQEFQFDFGSQGC